MPCARRQSTTENKAAPQNQPAAQHPGTDAGTVHAPPPRPLRSGRTIRREITRQLRQTTYVYVESAGHKDLHTICTRSSLAWQRGRLGSRQVVVVVANFSDLSTPPGPSPDYVVHNWPTDPSGPEMAGDQPGARRPTGMDQPTTIFDRETKIYTLV
jgi:hypothetical protein